MSEHTRDLSLEEWIGRWPEAHRATRELRELQAELARLRPAKALAEAMRKALPPTAELERLANHFDLIEGAKAVRSTRQSVWPAKLRCWAEDIRAALKAYRLAQQPTPPDNDGCPNCGAAVLVGTCPQCGTEVGAWPPPVARPTEDDRSEAQQPPPLSEGD